MVRHKNRYLLVELNWEDGKGSMNVPFRSLVDVLKEAVRQHFGDFGSAHVVKSLQCKLALPEVDLCVLRAGMDSHRVVWAALSLLNALGKRAVTLRVVGVSGSARTGRTAAVAHLRALEAAMPAAERRAVDWAGLAVRASTELMP